MDEMQFFFSITYTISMLCISIGLGIFFKNNLFFFCQNRTAIFCMGFSSVPIFVSIWMMVTSFLPNIIWKKQFIILMPILVSFFYLYKNRKSIFKDTRQIFLNANRWTLAAVISISAALIVFFCKIWIISIDVRAGQDGSFYMAEALRFAKSLSFRDIASHRDFPDGSLPGSPHNFGWPAFISYALLFSTKIESIGHDLPALLSMRYTFLYLLFSIMGIAYLLFEKIEYVVLALVLYLLSPYRDYLFASSRDFYRMIPALLTLMTLYLLIKRDKQLEMSRWEYAFIFVLGFFAISGHPINVFWVLPIGIAGCIVYIYRNREIKSIFKSIMIYVFGLAVGAYNIIYAYIDTGDLSGKSSLYSENIFRGTELEEIYLNRIKNSMIVDKGIFETLNQIFTMDKYHLIFIGAVSMVLLMVFFLIKKKGDFIFFSLSNLLCILIIFVGSFFKWGGGFSLPQWLSRNARYSLHYYLLAILCFLFLVRYLVELFSKIFEIKYVYSIAIIMLSIFLINMSVSLKIKNRIEDEKDYFALVYQPVIEQQKNLQKGMTILVPGQSYPYTLNLNARVLSSYFGVPIFRAESEKDILDYLRKEKVQFVCIDKFTVDALYQYSRFYPIMKGSDNFIPIFENDSMEIYQVSGRE